MKNMLGTAIAIASAVHENQTDKGGKPYILHPLRMFRGAYTNLANRVFASEI